MTGFVVTAHLGLLVPEPTPVSEPQNNNSSMQPPTEQEGEITLMYCFHETFEIINFSGRQIIYIWQPIIKNSGGSFLWVGNQLVWNLILLWGLESKVSSLV